MFTYAVNYVVIQNVFQYVKGLNFMERNKVVMSVSGGMDSATMVAYYLDKGYDVIPVHFQYGSKHNPYELPAAQALCAHYELELLVIDMTEAFSNIASNLMQSGGDIPEGHYADANMSKTVIPGRNTIFAAVLCGIAESCDASTIALGTHMGDHAVYPDCRAEYTKALDTLIFLASDKKVSVEAPFQFTDKIGICTMGLTLRVPYAYTRTCYKAQELSCGKCGSCVERLEAFAENNTTDPIEYE